MFFKSLVCAQVRVLFIHSKLTGIDMSAIQHIETRLLSSLLEKPLPNHVYLLDEIHAIEVRGYVRHFTMMK